ncbi:glucoamylase family protein [Gemmatimonas sp.]|uniref:glucoamylase family protein n=1 Tax=Gemmatimonas sp. TaxID=1962908 RepID=UPI0039838674
MLHALQRDTFAYLLDQGNPVNGLVADTTADGAPASIAVVGFALAAYPVGVERGFCSRAWAAERTLTTLQFFWNSPQGVEPDATGYNGFYYHFLHMQTGRRVWESELSTVDSTYLLAGMLTAAVYFDGDTDDEAQIRALADALYRRVDWRWAQNGGATVTHGWRPESGFLPYRWQGYDEALLLYVLGLGSPTCPLPTESYTAWTSTFAWSSLYGHELLHAGPLFIHQFSQLWIDCRGIQDAFMREKRIDYFENSRRATYVQQAYAVQNPFGFVGYGESAWGLTASDGPGPDLRNIDGVEREFFGYRARGVPNGPDDGTLAPWGIIASLPFAPEIALPAIRHCQEVYPQTRTSYGFIGSFNPTYPSTSDDGSGWICPVHLALNQGPNVSMIENYRTGFPWKLMRGSAYIVAGLRRAGFTNGWL